MFPQNWMVKQYLESSKIVSEGRAMQEVNKTDYHSIHFHTLIRPQAVQLPFIAGTDSLELETLVAFATLVLARAIACEGRCRDIEPLGLGRPFLGFKQFRIDIASHLFTLNLHLQLFTIWLAMKTHTLFSDHNCSSFNYSLSKIFRAFNFRTFLCVRNILTLKLSCSQDNYHPALCFGF